MEENIYNLEWKYIKAKIIFSLHQDYTRVNSFPGGDLVLLIQIVEALSFWVSFDVLLKKMSNVFCHNQVN